MLRQKQVGGSAKRMDELDFLKAVFILLMVAFHLVYIGNKYPYAKAVVYTFHMPGFLLISGYLANTQKNGEEVFARNGAFAPPLPDYGGCLYYLSRFFADSRAHRFADRRDILAAFVAQTFRALLVLAYACDL